MGKQIDENKVENKFGNNNVVFFPEYIRVRVRLQMSILLLSQLALFHVFLACDIMSFNS